MYDHSPNRNIYSLTPSEVYNSTIIQVLLLSLHHKWIGMTTGLLSIKRFLMFSLTRYPCTNRHVQSHQSNSSLSLVFHLTWSLLNLWLNIQSWLIFLYYYCSYYSSYYIITTQPTITRFNHGINHYHQFHMIPSEWMDNCHTSLQVSKG